MNLTTISVSEETRDALKLEGAINGIKIRELSEAIIGEVLNNKDLKSKIIKDIKNGLHEDSNGHTEQL